MLNNPSNNEELEYMIEEYFKKDYYFMMDNIKHHLDNNYEVEELSKIYKYLQNNLKIEDEIFLLINKRKKSTKNFSFQLDCDCLKQNSKKLQFYSQGRTIKDIEDIKFNSKRYFTIIVDDLSIEVYLTITQDKKETTYSEQDSPHHYQNKYQPKDISVSSDEEPAQLFYNHNGLLCGNDSNVKRV